MHIRWPIRAGIFGLWLLTAGCIIGTWPTPENRGSARTSAPPAEQSVGDETCGDGLDNDGDGVVDEGCSCDAGQQRGCVGTVGDQCGLGVQECLMPDGVWSRCGDVGPPFSGKRTAAIEIIEYTPAALCRDTDPFLSVRVEPTAHCPGIIVPHVRLELRAADPLMTVYALARDDGSGNDQVAGDGLYSGELGNPFGPGVPAQDLTLHAIVLLADAEYQATATVSLVDP